jgi:Ala-tRNA(Pro) deacylase
MIIGGQQEVAMLDRHTRRILDRFGVHYATLPAPIGPEATPGRRPRVAETLLIRVDDRPTLVLVPTGARLDLERVGQEAYAATVRPTTAHDFRERFPGCQPGTMPPLSFLWGIDLFADRSLADGHLAFHIATTDDELLALPWADFVRLMNPLVGGFIDAPADERVPTPPQRRARAFPLRLRSPAPAPARG